MSDQNAEERVPLRLDEEDNESTSTPTETDELHTQLNEDPRFNPIPPSKAKRIALLFAVIGLFWLAFYIRPGSGGKKVIHAHRYSKEHKFRPAASPIVTETLVDGRLKVRGAAATVLSTPTPTQKTYEERKAKALRRAKGKKPKKSKRRSTKLR